jgi:hypothetical protein
MDYKSLNNYFGDKPGKISITIIGGIFLIVISFFLGRSSVNNLSLATQTNSQPVAPSPYAKESINKDFSFPIKDNNSNDISTIKYSIQNAQLENSVIIKGQKADAIKGKTFLILNIKLSNNYTQGVDINTRDYVRLKTSSVNELLAPDLYNDPVQVQAISTKSTTLGFTINNSDKNLELQIGEIKGTKQNIKLAF